MILCLDYECGKAIENTRIFGGEKTCDGCIPWQVRVLEVSAKSSCGGTIIAPRFIMTAGHCTFPKTTPEDFLIQSGATDLKKAKISHVKQIHLHPKHKETFKFFGIEFSSIYDYLILELKLPLNLGEGSMARAVCLPEIGDVAKFRHGKTKLLASGWGTGNDPKNILRQIEVGWVSDAKCKKSLIKRLKEKDYKNNKDIKKFVASVGGKNKFADKIIHKTVICAHKKLKKTDWNDPRVCSGDSGGTDQNIYFPSFLKVLSI